MGFRYPFEMGPDDGCEPENWTRSDGSKPRAPRTGRTAKFLKVVHTIMSDHLSGPRALADPAIDIPDFYAFPSPSVPAQLVLVMNLFPYARPPAFFSTAAKYRFRLRPVNI